MNTSETKFEKFESQLAEWKVQVAKLEAKVAEAGAEAKPAFLREVDELKEKFSKTEKHYIEASKAQKGTSPDDMDGLSSAWHDLGHAVGKAVGRFG
ncbi:MAG: cytochrome c556 [Glaciecola sp.]|jgi:cytochrome c556